MKIITLTAENFKRLHAVRITPDGALVQITGKNAAGKSSVLDAIQAALGGTGNAPPKPIRDGQSSASVVLDLGDITVTRRWTSNERSTLVVESKEGARYNSPQSMIDKLVGSLSFDPLAFSRMDEQQQATTLRDLAGIDTSDIDLKRAKLFEERTGVNREIKRLEATLAGATPSDDVPDEEISVAALAAENQAAQAQKAKNEKIRAAAEQARLDAQKCLDDTEKIRLEVVALKMNLATKADELKILQARWTKAQEVTAAMVDPDTDGLADKVKEADAVNVAVRRKKEMLARYEEAKAKSLEADKLTGAIAVLDAQKATALYAAKFPIEGLALTDDLVTFGGMPLSQASSAEQLRVGLAIGAALNPKLRVVLVRDGSLLDADGLKIVAEWAERENMQTFMERVTDGTGVGVVIEDGEVVGAEAAQEGAA